MIARNDIVAFAMVVDSLFLICLLIFLFSKHKRDYIFFFHYHETLVKIFTIVFALVFITSNLGVAFLPDNTQYNIDDVELSQRISELSNSLSESATELSKIQDDLNNRIEFVTELKKQAEIAENTINLTDEQVKAIRQQLNEGGKVSTLFSVVASFIISAFFFVIGIIIGRKN